MDPTPLVTEEIEAGADLVKLFDKAMPVTVALWAKLADASQWYLYIASDRIDAVGLDEGYREIRDLVREVPDIDFFRVKLIPSNHPLASAALEVNRRFPGSRLPTRSRLQNKVVGSTFVEGAYIYPELASLPTS